MIQNALSIIVALGVLITFHEFGHYLIARRCGVKVLRFSVGFGKPIYRYVAASGTEFTLAMIPLGGYVRMLDEREGDVPHSLRTQAFNQKSVWQRFAIVAAGPIANFILAIILYAFVALMGMQTLVPKVGEVAPNTPLSQTSIQAGDEIIGLAGKEVNSWEEINLALADLIGRTGEFDLRYHSEQNGQDQQDSFSLERWMAGEDPASLISAFGVTPWRPAFIPVIDQVMEGGAALKAGFKPGDLILEINGVAVSEWNEVVVWIQKSPNAMLDMLVARQGKTLHLTLTPQAKNSDGVTSGYAGMSVEAPEVAKEDLRVIDYGVFQSAAYGVQQTWQMTALTFSSIVKMLQGLISVDNLSGPITIAKVASASAASGLQSFLKFMAYLSVSLGVLNLLPIPMLDGGHLLFFAVEAVRGKPVSERIQGIAYRLGASLLFAMMAVALFNDFARL